MDLRKNGKLLYALRKAKGMTQKQIADKLGIVPKTVSKWETGHGFPDVSTVTALADILGVSERTLLSGVLLQNTEEVGNMKKLKFYVCAQCGAFVQGTGNSRISCCGKPLEILRAKQADEKHAIVVSEIENDFYITFDHEMTKEHFISFFAYVTFDKVLTARVYPEQDSAVRFPMLHGGTFYYYCNRHGLFEFQPAKRQKNQPDTSLTALVSAFARAYHFENSANPVFRDTMAGKLFSDEEYRQMERYIRREGDVKTYVNSQLAPNPLARARFCEDSLETAVRTGTEQYVILGSGLDTYALRCDNPKIRVFEIERENTLADKIKRIERAKLEIPDTVRYIAADLAKENFKTLLEKNGFNRNKKTFFSCLGLLYYLSGDEIAALFADIASFAAEGSTVVFDFADPHFFSSDVPRVKEMIKLAEKSGESMKTCFGYGELEMFLQEHGFLLYEFLCEKEIQSRYFADSADGLTAFEHINYALAVLKQ